MIERLQSLMGFVSYSSYILWCRRPDFRLYSEEPLTVSKGNDDVCETIWIVHKPSIHLPKAFVCNVDYSIPAIRCIVPWTLNPNARGQSCGRRPTTILVLCCKFTQAIGEFGSRMGDIMSVKAIIWKLSTRIVVALSNLLPLQLDASQQVWPATDVINEEAASAATVNDRVSFRNIATACAGRTKIIHQMKHVRKPDSPLNCGCWWKIEGDEGIQPFIYALLDSHLSAFHI